MNDLNADHPDFVIFAEKLYEIGAIKIGKFKLKSGVISPFYLDLRLIPSKPDIFKFVVQIYKELIAQLNYHPECIAGLISAGIPFATGISLDMNIPLLQIRSDVKEHGTKKMIEGILPKKYTKIVLIDDLISTGATKLPAIEELRSKGYIVKDLIVLIDRTNDEGKKIMEDARVKIHSLGTPDSIIKWLMKSSIDKDELLTIQEKISEWKDL